MDQVAVRCTFMRGGTSKGMFFRWEDLPAADVERDAFLCAAIGSPDPYGRQLDGMGGGISSLSKAMIVRRSNRAGIDVDYLFGQIAVDKPQVDYASNCGNLSAAVGAFAIDQGLVQLPDGPGAVRMFNENTSKRVDCLIEVRGGRAAVAGDMSIAGVAGTGAPIRLDFHDPGGARTGQLLPEGTVRGKDGIRSFVDAANPCVFVLAEALGLTACELPSEIAAMPDVMNRLEHIRRIAGVAGGVAGSYDDMPESAPKVALVGPPCDAPLLTGEILRAEACDVQVRMISMGKPHLAIPLTGAMCTAVAARIAGTTVAEVAGGMPAEAAAEHALRIGTPSGVVPARADVRDGAVALSASVYRTARKLMEGVVYGAA